MPDKKDEPRIYRVLCWDACIPDHPCGLEYDGMRYETDALIALPPSVAKRHIEKGRLALEKDKSRAHGGIPLADVVYVVVVDEGAQGSTDAPIEGEEAAQ
jgi:hypothetical protein